MKSHARENPYQEPLNKIPEILFWNLIKRHMRCHAENNSYTYALCD